MARLNADTLRSLSPAEGRHRLRLPAYRREDIAPGIVHLGVGAFHRAHMAVYIDDLLSTHPEWGIVGASLRRPDAKAALAPQDYFYTVAERDASGTACRVIGSIIDVLDAGMERERLLDLMADPRIRIVSLTVTEKGYCHDPATGELDANHPDIVHDRLHPSSPVSAPGLLVEALHRRLVAGCAPFTVLSCDNLPANGKTTKRIVTALAALRAADLATHIRRHVAFPSTMVDRIVPATTQDDRDLVETLTGLKDAWPVVTEPFSQWVIEDWFPMGRPPFEAAGAQMVGDVEPFETMKLRLLNGSHSAIAYLGQPAGHRFVNEAVADPGIFRFLHAMMSKEVMPTLDLPGADLEAYRDRLLARFANPALQHRTSQIAMDGTQKLPQRLLGTIRERLAVGGGIERLAMGVAGWMRYVTGVDEAGRPFEVRDPLVAQLRSITAAAGGNAEALTSGLLGLGEVFGADLPTHGGFRAVVTRHLGSLLEVGSAATIERLRE